MKISFITTVLNEEKTIKLFLDSLINQSKLPDEIIIVDGGSTDATASLISNFKPWSRAKSEGFQISNKRIKFKFITKKGNRSVGRNEAINNTTSDIILISDAGCILDKHWIENISMPFKDRKIDVAAGYYEGLSKSLFQKCLVPYVLVMPDKVDPGNFLPSTRSIAFRKSVWKKAKYFSENLSHNEDYDFAVKLKNINANIFFVKNAITKWLPRNNFRESFKMFFKFSFGDIEAKIYRSRVLLLFVRYLLGLYFIFLSMLYMSFIPLIIISLLLISYIIWSVKKNYRYVNNKKAFIILPLLQITADAAVLSGTTFGLLKSVINFSYVSHLKKNKILFFVVIIYTLLMFLLLEWGAPNKDHPFPYHMDEWHQLQAVRATFKFGTPNVSGAANGTMFQFLLAGFYLIPFTVFQIINPFVIKISDFVTRENIIEILRMNTILYGALSIVVFYAIARILDASRKTAIILFTFSPVWLMLSNYFKYDIALMFWILLSMLFILKFYKNPIPINYLSAAIPAGLSLAVKVSAIPILLIYILSYFWFTVAKKRDYKYFLLGILTYILVVLLFGVPDTLFGKGNIYDYLYNNIVQSPSITPNFQLENPYIYLFLSHYPSMFGHGLILLFVFSIIIWVYFFLKEGLSSLKKNKPFFIIIFSLLTFLFSLLPLKMQAVSNRALVLLPFLILIIILTYKKIRSFQKLKILFFILLILTMFTQIFESFSWLYVKFTKNPQEVSSKWIKENIPNGQLIGIENIPIYQFLPNVVEQEYYFKQYQIQDEYNFKYQVIDSRTRELPSFIIITSGKEEEKFFKETPKKDLLKRLRKENYKEIAFFSPDLTFLKYVASDLDYYTANIVTTPLSIVIYKK